MAAITTRAGKGSALTNAEVDANFTNLNTEVGTKLDATLAAVLAALGYTPLNAAGDTMVGKLGIGNTTPGNVLNWVDIRGDKGITNGANAIGGFSAAFTAADAATTSAAGFATFLNPGTGVALTTLTHFAAAQRAFVGTAATQTGFEVASSLTGGAVNYGFRGRIAAGTDRWNLFMDGTAINHLAGSLFIGTTVVTADALRIGKTITGDVNSNGIVVNGSVQSDVTTRASYFRTVVNTQAAAFTLPALYHYEAAQNASFGAGSTVTNQVGFRVDNTLTGATNNWGFQGLIPSGTGRYNLYMSGTAQNYLNGRTGFGTNDTTNGAIRMSLPITGGTTQHGMEMPATIQSDVTGDARGFATGIGTQATAFTLTNLTHFHAIQGTFGAGSAVTNQTGFMVGGTLTGATNNYAFRSTMAAGTGRWALYMDGAADNYLAGALGVGNNSLTGYNLRVERALGGATTVHGIASNGQTTSAVTGTSNYFSSYGNTQAAAFTLGTLRHYFAEATASFGAGSTVTTQAGFQVSPNLIGAGTNYGFRGEIPSGAGRWNAYMDGTAANHFAGDVLIGQTTNANSSKVVVNGTVEATGFRFPTGGLVTAAHGMSVSIQASEALAAGDLVNIHDVGGAFRVRKASAASAGLEAHGFVLGAVASGASVNVYFDGLNNSLSGLTPGRRYLSTTPGLTTTTAPTTAGQVVQRIGIAVAANSIKFQPGEPVLLS